MNWTCDTFILRISFDRFNRWLVVLSSSSFLHELTWNNNIFNPLAFEQLSVECASCGCSKTCPFVVRGQQQRTHAKHAESCAAHEPPCCPREDRGIAKIHWFTEVCPGQQRAKVRSGQQHSHPSTVRKGHACSKLIGRIRAWQQGDVSTYPQSGAGHHLMSGSGVSSRRTMCSSYRANRRSPSFRVRWAPAERSWAGSSEAGHSVSRTLATSFGCRDCVQAWHWTGRASLMDMIRYWRKHDKHARCPHSVKQNATKPLLVCCGQPRLSDQASSLTREPLLQKEGRGKEGTANQTLHGCAKAKLARRSIVDLQQFDFLLLADALFQRLGHWGSAGLTDHHPYLLVLRRRLLLFLLGISAPIEWGSQLVSESGRGRSLCRGGVIVASAGILMVFQSGTSLQWSVLSWTLFKKQRSQMTPSRIWGKDLLVSPARDQHSGTTT